MRRFAVLILIVILEMFCISVDAEFALPASLNVIEDEAFFGTAAEAVVIPNDAEYVGRLAFAKIPSLYRVEIPESVSFIADDAFLGAEHLVIWGSSRTYAEGWAHIHGIPFLDVALLAAELPDAVELVNYGTALCGVMLLIVLLLARFYNLVSLEIRVRRRIAELYPLLYDFP